MSIISEIKVFDNYRIITLDNDKTVLSVQVTDTALNPYGSAHGGYLYTLSDMVAGIAAAGCGHYCVTLQASVNYIAPAKKDDELFVEGTCTHNGRSTKVIEVKTTNQKGELITSAVFTMYCTAPISHNQLEEMRSELLKESSK